MKIVGGGAIFLHRALTPHDVQAADRLLRGATIVPCDGAAAKMIDGLRRRLELARGALADIALSSDMTLELARKKAKRIYRQTEGREDET